MNRRCGSRARELRQSQLRMRRNMRVFRANAVWKTNAGRHDRRWAFGRSVEGCENAGDTLMRPGNTFFVKDRYACRSRGFKGG